MTERVTLREAIARQPQSLADGIAALRAQLKTLPLSSYNDKTTIITGIGASLYAAQAGAAHFRARGLRAFALPSTDLYDPTLDAADVYIALSASGRSVEPAKAMELRPHAESYGVSGVPEGPLKAYVKHMVGTACGADSGPNVTSYLGTLLALGMMAERAGRGPAGDWTALPEYVSEVLGAAPEKIAQIAPLFRGHSSLDCVGSGEAFGTAGYASLLLREAPRVSAQQWDTLNFLHGPMEPNTSATGVILIGNGREVELSEVLAGFGIPVLLITTRSDVYDSRLLVTLTVPDMGNQIGNAILQALPLQLLTAQLAEDAGLPVCEFRYRQTGTKITVPA